MHSVARIANPHACSESHALVAQGMVSLFLLRLLGRVLPNRLDSFFCAFIGNIPITLVPVRQPLGAMNVPILKFFASSKLRSLVCLQEGSREIVVQSHRVASRGKNLRISSCVVMAEDDQTQVGRQFEITLLLHFIGELPTVKACVIVYDERGPNFSQLSETSFCQLSDEILKEQLARLVRPESLKSWISVLWDKIGFV